MRWPLLTVFVFVFAMGCGEVAPSDFDRASAAGREGYPAGPYGTRERSVLEDLTFVAPDGSRFSLADVHADGGNRLILVSTAAGWCTACIEEQPRLQALHREYYARGLFVLVSVFEDAGFAPATAALAADWRARYALDLAVVADPDFVFAPYYDPTLTPMTMIVDAETMEIVWKITGWDQSSVEAILAARLR